MRMSVHTTGLARQINLQSHSKLQPRISVPLRSAPLDSSSSMTTKPELRDAGPAPQVFTPAEGQIVNLATAAIPFVMRLGSGGFNAGYTVGFVEDDGGYAVARSGGKKLQESSLVGSFKRPVLNMELYEFEGCPFCKKVREAISILDLDVMVYPTPKNGATWRPKAAQIGGKAQFPYLVDPNTNRSMYESDDIITYLFNEYGDGKVPLGLRLGPLTMLTCALSGVARGGAGNTARPSRQPELPLVFWAYELSPFVKVVREVLCELELPYLQKTAARGSPKRQELFAKRGAFQVPYLEDPNTGVYLFESTAIIKYINDTYAA